MPLDKAETHAARRASDKFRKRRITMPYLIAYDIASPKRLQRVHRYLTDNAIPLQNSTFLFTASRGRFEYCWAQLARLIDRREDDIRAYPLPADSLRLELGSKIPEGVYCL